MSLRVWLPLTKDLRNQGLDDVTVTNNGATFNANGKLGGCYKTSNSGDIDLKYSGAQINTGSLSLCGWFKFNKVELAATWGSYSFDSTYHNPTGNLIGNNSYGGVGLIWSTNSLVSGAAFTSLYVACSIRSTTNGPRATSNVIIPFDTWVHLALVFNKSTKALELWLNGELKVTNAMLDFNDAKTDNLKLNYRAVWGGNGPSYNIPFLVNDVRIYDHALSPMEVKQISQGLILHYPLNRNGWGQENLITGYDTSFLSYPNGVVTLFSNQMNGGVQEIVSNIEGAIKCLHLHSNGGKGRQYGIFSATSGKSYTISCDYYSTSSQAVPFRGELNGGDYSWAGSNAVAYTTPNKWVRLSFSHLNLTSSATIYYFMQCSQNTDCYIKNLKIEEGSIVTSWCPNSTDALTTTMGLNDNVEYDCSGFNNNGEKIGINYSSDTPKYDVSSVFSASPSVIKIPNLNYAIQGSLNMTISVWAYKEDWSQYAERIYSCTEGGGLNILLSSNNMSWSVNVYTDAEKTSHKYATSSPDLYIRVPRTDFSSGWHMFTWVYTTSGTLLYVDGVLKQSKTGTSYGLCFHSTAPLILGGEATAKGYTSPYLNGKLSDFRIYCIALSAEDVKSLYNNSAYIDNQGNIYGAVYEEV